MTCALKVAVSPSVTERTVLVYPITIAATHRKRVMLVHHVTVMKGAHDIRGAHQEDMT